MSLSSYLLAVQKKPEAIRQKIFYLLFGLGTSVVLMLWIATVRATTTASRPEEQVRTTPFTELKLFTLEAGALIKEKFR